MKFNYVVNSLHFTADHKKQTRVAFRKRNQFLITVKFLVRVPVPLLCTA